jgi:hypothetical protein
MIDQIDQLPSEPVIVDALGHQPTQVGDVLAVHQHNQLLEVGLGRSGRPGGRQQLDVLACSMRAAGRDGTEVHVASPVGQNAHLPGHRVYSL